MSTRLRLEMSWCPLFLVAVVACGSNPVAIENGEDAPEILPVLILDAPVDGAEDLSTPVSLVWNAVAGAEDYHVQVATDAAFADLVVNDLTRQTSHAVDALDDGATYIWRVRPLKAGAVSAWSEAWSFQMEGEAGDPGDPDEPSAFVGVEDGNFVVDGEVFRFAGTNAYYLPNYQKLDPAVVTRALDAFEEAGITVVRMWAFYDGYDCGYSAQDATENVIQTAPEVYDEDALQDLDAVIAAGKERDIRFILALVNYWDELGGICQYNTWAGASDPGRNMTFFMENEDTQAWYRSYVEMLLTRVNTETGVAYRDEPAIFAWEIINEARNSGADPEILRDWYQEMAQFIKSIDENHMVSTGEDGYDEGTPDAYSVEDYSNTYVLRAEAGTSYLLNTAIPEIDYGTAHWYPSDFGFGHEVNEAMITAQRAWLRDHQDIATALGKPFFLGEYGFPGFGDERVEAIYGDLWEYAETIQLDGSALWQLTADHVKCYEFGGNICWPGAREDETLYQAFRAHIEAMQGGD